MSSTSHFELIASELRMRGWDGENALADIIGCSPDDANEILDGSRPLVSGEAKRIQIAFGMSRNGQFLMALQRAYYTDLERQNIS